MTVLVTKKISKKELKKAIIDMLIGKKKQGLKKYFGTAIEKIKAVEFQRELRDEYRS